MQGWHYGKGLIYYRSVSYIYVLRGPLHSNSFFIFSIFSNPLQVVGLGRNGTSHGT